MDVLVLQTGWGGGREQLPTINQTTLCDILNLHLAPSWTGSLGWVGCPSGGEEVSCGESDECLSLSGLVSVDVQLCPVLILQ